MKVLVLGATGMLGHRVFLASMKRGLETEGTGRRPWPCPPLGFLHQLRATHRAERLFAEHFDVVVNCIGVVKQRAETPTRELYRTNGLWPHMLASWCPPTTRLIHLSTDCVFSGKAGHYAEDDRPDPVDDYGRSKALGELHGPNCLTLRTSFIGRELSGARGLLEWFIGQRGGTVPGWTDAVFSGVTTSVLANLIVELIDQHPRLSGLYHVAAAPVSKFHLLHLVNEAFGLDVTIEPTEHGPCNRTLLATKLRLVTGWEAPSWEEMIDGLRADPTPYDEWREECLTESA